MRDLSGTIGSHRARLRTASLVPPQIARTRLEISAAAAAGFAQRRRPIAGRGGLPSSPRSSGIRSSRRGTSRSRPRRPEARPTESCRAARAAGSSAGDAARFRRPSARPRRAGRWSRPAALASAASFRSAFLDRRHPLDRQRLVEIGFQFGASEFTWHLRRTAPEKRPRSAAAS